MRMEKWQNERSNECRLQNLFGVTRSNVFASRMFADDGDDMS